jgi:hypothetical protein
MKYIRHETLGLIVFECRHLHKDIARLLEMQKSQIMSAGFVDAAKPEDVFCMGGSHGLGKRASAEDTKILQANIDLNMGVGS